MTSTNRILINAANTTGAGARSICLSLIPELARSYPQWRFSVLVPDDEAFRALPGSGNMELVFRKRQHGLGNDIARLWELLWYVPRLAKAMDAAACLTLGDINPAGLSCPGVLFVQQALLAYDRRELAGSRTWRWGKHALMQRVFARTVTSADAVIVQTAVMAERLQARYHIPQRTLTIVGQPVPQALRDATLTAAPDPVMAGHKKGVKLLFLAGGYPHKNHACLAAVARELRRRGIAGNVHIYTTIDAAAHAGLVRDIIHSNSDVITNLGVLTAAGVAGAFRAASALFLPTLIESYGLIYLEAMEFGLPIVTSDRDFSREMCRDRAVYFDPHDAVSIVDAIQMLPAAPGVRHDRDATAELNGRFPADWKQVADELMAVLRQAMPGNRPGEAP